MATSAPITYNHDVAGLYRRVNRFILEMLKSVSGGGSQTNQFDQGRLQSYIDAIRAYKNWVENQPQLDLPETHPRAIALEESPATDKLENESVRDVIYLLELARDELVNSQSSRNGAGFMSFDGNRFAAVVDKTEQLLQTYIATITPLDLPESTPMRDITEHGHTGV